MPSIREFTTGATRDTAQGKPQYEGYLSPIVLKRFGQYMLHHQMQSDGNLRASDNWQKGIPRQAYMDSMLRHLMDVWEVHDHGDDAACQECCEDLEESLCALLFNVQGYLFEVLHRRDVGEK